MRKIALSLGLAAASATSIIAMAPAAGASEPVAQAACFTLWDTHGFNGGSRAFSANDADFRNNNWSNGLASNNAANAAKNRCSFRVHMYDGLNYAGQAYSIQGNSEDSDFGNNAFSNKASSLNGF
ncbi:hypothetical protein [Streptomyces sp. NPDC007346]|uniref:hypothetical protein n=1 Tax=Streptomyces sp. NPDC007346 TaxID=3154682 RepID=UPI0034513F28